MRSCNTENLNNFITAKIITYLNFSKKSNLWKKKCRIAISFEISCYLKILLSSLLIKFLLFSKKKIINFFIYFFNMQFFPLLVQITFFYVCLFFFSLNFVTDITLSRAKGWWWIFQLWWWRRVWWNGRYGLHPWGLATSKHFSFCSLARDQENTFSIFEISHQVFF